MSEAIALLLTGMLTDYALETTGFEERSYLTDFGAYTLAHHLTGALISQFDITERVGR